MNRKGKTNMNKKKTQKKNMKTKGVPKSQNAARSSEISDRSNNNSSCAKKKQLTNNKPDGTKNLADNKFAGSIQF